MSLSVLLLVVLFGIATAQPSERCAATPSTWSGYIYAIEFRLGKLELLISLANYDRESQKIKITDTDVSPGSPKRTTLEEWSTKTRYVSENGQCRKERIEEAEFPKFGVPEGAKRIGAPEYLGSKLPNLGVLVEQYSRAGSEGEFFGTFAPIGNGEMCVPIITSTLTVVPLAESLLEYVNVTTTLPVDPFSIPPGCK
uniref:Uncharacterized protein n=1 Tax=Amphimedon queenslandica TaxID=400682 RepID=A0A1X7U1H1_AMPQE